MPSNFFSIGFRPGFERAVLRIHVYTAAAINQYLNKADTCRVPNLRLIKATDNRRKNCFVVSELFVD